MIKEYKNPMNDLLVATRKDFGSYNKRRQELLENGEKWFLNRVKRWNRSLKIPEFEFDQVETEVC